jgi:hypothetical protein
MNQVKHPLDLHHLGVLSGASKMISEPTVCFAQTMHLSCADTNTIFEWSKSSFHLSLVTKEYHWVCPKWFLSLRYVRHKPCTYLALWLALYQMNWIKHPLELRHLRVLSGASKTISLPTICLAQNVHLSCADTNNISKMDQNEIPHDPCHLEVPSGASKMISKAAVCSAQTVHLSCVKISTIFKRTESSFHLSLVT